MVKQLIKLESQIEYVRECFNWRNNMNIIIKLVFWEVHLPLSCNNLLGVVLLNLGTCMQPAWLGLWQRQAWPSQSFLLSAKLDLDTPIEKAEVVSILLWQRCSLVTVLSKLIYLSSMPHSNCVLSSTLLQFDSFIVTKVAFLEEFKIGQVTCRKIHAT